MVTVGSKLQREIKQVKPFSSLEAETYLNVVVTAQKLNVALTRALRDADLSLPQYNVLRILRGAGEEGLTCREIGDRMVHRVPDVTRLLDRLETRGLVGRNRETGDRRVVRVRISPEGENLIAPLDTPVADLHRKQLGHLGEKRLRQLIRLLEEARGD